MLHSVGVDLDLIFKALSDATRRRLVEELHERDCQTLFELHGRLVNWHGLVISRQALSHHLGVLEEAGLVRTEWEWRSKFHFLEREPLRRLRQIWLAPLADGSKESFDVEDHSNERTRR